MTSSIRLKRDQSEELLDRLYAEDYYWYLSSYEYHFKFLKDLAIECVQCGNSVLDIGCGEGQLAFAIDTVASLTKTFRYEGFDASPIAIKKATNRNKQFVSGLTTKFRVRRFEDLPEKHVKQTDTVVFGNILSVLVDPEDHIEMVRRYLKKYRANYFIIYELERFPTDKFREEWKLIQEYHNEAILTLEKPKLRRKIEVYQV